MNPVRRAAVRALDAVLDASGRPIADEDLRGPALVLAPHPDDETLGCGGAIGRFRREGEPVTIVLLTDGRTSHQHLLPGEELARIRAREVVEAAGVLGVDATDVIQLGCRDGRLAAEADRAAATLREILVARRPSSIFVPAPCEPQPDHEAAHRIALAALAEARLAATLWRYPVWSWRFWPVAALEETNPLGRLAAIRESAGRAAGFLLRFRHRLRLSPEERARKREALLRHATQTTRPENRPEWTTLGDVWDGLFLARFCGREERFERVEFRPLAIGTDRTPRLAG